MTARELQKVKNQNAAGNFRDLQGNFQLLMNLLIRDEQSRLGDNQYRPATL